MDFSAVFDRLSKFWNPKSFSFQLCATFSVLFLLTKLIGAVDFWLTLFATVVLLVVVSWEITKIVRKFYFKEPPVSAAKKAVLVTGCDSGFGHGLADRLNRLGFTVYAACLNQNSTGAQDLLRKAANPKATHLVEMDVTSQADVDRVCAQVTSELAKNGHSLWAIVNNAGISQYSMIEWGKFESFEKILEVNLIGMARVTRAFLPLIRKCKGRVVNVSSLAGRIAAPGLSAYAMSKFGVTAFSDALRREMSVWGVKVITIEPAGYRTAMTQEDTLIKDLKRVWDETPEQIRKDYGQEYFETTFTFLKVNDHTGNPEQVVDAMVDAISAVEPEIVYRVCGLISYSLSWLLNDYLPNSMFDFLLKQKMTKVKPSGAK